MFMVSNAKIRTRSPGCGLDKLFREALTCQTAILSGGFRRCAPCKEKRKDCILQSSGCFLRGFGYKWRWRRGFQEAILLRVYNHIIAEIAVPRL